MKFFAEFQLFPEKFVKHCKKRAKEKTPLRSGAFVIALSGYRQKHFVFD